MKQNKLNIILITVIMIIFISYFIISSLYIEKNMSKLLDSLEEHTIDENWVKSREIAKNIEKDWVKKKFLIMCNYGETEINGFEMYINNISGSVKAEEIDTALTTILSAQDAWKNLNKIIPLP